jgi:TusA-related sulfurtransferase
MTDNTTTQTSEFFIDITNDVCPMTFVRTKLALEKVPVGSVLTVRLNSGEPLNNVPRSAIDHGHTVLSLVAEEPSQSDDSVHVLQILKTV